MLSLSDDKRLLIGNVGAGVTVGLGQQPTAAHGARFKTRPMVLVMHYTAGHSFKETVDLFMDPKNERSAHLVVGRNMEIVQMVPFDTIAWHAGQSQWNGHRSVNGFSIGIEFDNYGPLHKVGGDFLTWFGRKVDPVEVEEVDPRHPNSFGIRFWHAFSAWQLETAAELAKLLVVGLSLQAIVGHAEIAFGHKQDPGPAFPLLHLRSLVTSRS